MQGVSLNEKSFIPSLPGDSLYRQYGKTKIPRHIGFIFYWYNTQHMTCQLRLSGVLGAKSSLSTFLITQCILITQFDDILRLDFLAELRG